MNESKFIKVNLSFGQWVYQLFLLQLLPVLYTLKGFVLLGVFPAIASTFNIFYQWIIFGKTDLSIRKHFKTFYEKYFWQANKLGWGLSIIGGILLFDLYISSTFIQSLFLHVLLVFLFFTFLVVSSYSFIVFARYEYEKISAYLKQSFYIGFTSIFQSIAIVLVAVVLYSVFNYLPFLYLFFGIPILLGAISWFAIQGVEKAEKMRNTLE